MCVAAIDQAHDIVPVDRRRNGPAEQFRLHPLPLVNGKWSVRGLVEPENSASSEGPALRTVEGASLFSL